jgi:urea transporter
VDPHEVIRTGATDIWTAFPSADIPGILHSYLAGLHLVFILAIVLGGLSFVVGLLAPDEKLNVSRAFGIEANIEEGSQVEEQK